MDSSRKNKTKALRKNTERAGLGAKSLQATTRKELAAQKYRQSIRDLIAGAGPVIARIAIQPETDAMEAIHQAIEQGEAPEMILIALESRSNRHPPDVVLTELIPRLKTIIENNS